MICPKCGEDNNIVLNCRQRRKTVDTYRRRLCLSCGERFSTKERYCPDEMEYLHIKTKK